MKKLKLFFVAMLLSAVAINSYAYQVGETIDVGDGFKYKILTLGPTWTVSVTSISLTGDVVIPSEVFDGKDVTFTVTQLACGGGEAITGITFPETLTNITINNVNAGFTGVSRIYIPKNLKCSDAFLVSNSSLESWDVHPDNPYYSVEDGILYSKDWKTLYSIPTKRNYVSSDGSYRVRDGVETVFFTTNTTPNYKGALYPNNCCSQLKTLILPTSCKTIPPFYRNSIGSLSAFVVDGEDEVGDYLSSKDGVLFNASRTKSLLYPNGKAGTTYTLPDGVTTVGQETFNHSYLSEIDLHDAKVLEYSAVLYNYYLTTLKLGKATTLANNSVHDNYSLKTIYIPATLTNITDGAFTSNTVLAAYIVEEGNPRYSSHDGVLYSAIKDDGTRDTLLLYPQGKTASTYTIPEEFGLKRIAAYAFSGAKITSFSLPSTVEEIGNFAFQKSSLKSFDIEMPSSLTTIGAGVFHSAKALKTFNWPEWITAIPTECFTNSGLESFVIPDNVTSIGVGAFKNTKLTTIEIPASVKSIGIEAFMNAPLSEATFVEKSNVTSIDGKAFANTNLTTITMPSTLLVLKGIFDGCNKLEEIIFPDGSDLTTIKAFGAPNLERFIFEGSSKLTTIESSAFMDHQNLKELHFPSSVTTINSQAFMNCKNLESITFEGGKAEITTIGKAAFADCGLKSFDVPNKVKTIGNEAFRNCEALTTVNLPAVTTSVDPQAFKGCSTLTAINVDKANTTYSSSDGILLTKSKETLVIFPMGKANENFTLLPPSITKIGNYSFYENENLTNVTIPNKVTSIGNRAFGLCPNLNTVTMLCDEMIDPANIAQALNYSAFDDGVTTADEQFSKITLNVRKDLLDDYQNNEYYQQFGEIKPSFIDETSRVGGQNKTNAKEEFIAVSQNTVDLLSVDTEDETYVLPTSVEQGGKTYAVSLVGDYLFTANGSSVANVKEVVVPGNIEYIGARAFLTNAALTSTASTVESVFLIGDQLNEDLLSTARFELTPEDLGSGNKKHYDEFGTATKIYVRKSAEDTYKTAWGSYADNISYKIPFAQTGEYGTFAREFDVDFSEVNGVDAEKPVTDDPVVIAFTGDGKYNKNGNTFSVHMTSINLGDQTGKDGTYVPAGSGVLMKKYKDAEGEDGLYYQIAETGISEAFVDGNFMKGITLRPETIGAGDDVKRYYISGGTLHEMTKDTNFKNHKSYMELPADAVPAGAKVTLSFGNWDNEATGIESINANVDDNDNLYNLQGQRVNNAGKGIYIKNGKKIFVK